MKVLFLSQQADFIFGGEMVTLAFMRELRAQGVEVHFASPPGPYFERAKEVAETHTIPARQFRRDWKKLPGFLRAWWKTQRAISHLVEDHGIHIVHATSLKAMVYAWGLGVPTIWHHHDILPTSIANHFWLKLIGTGVSLVLVPADASRAALVKAGVPGEKVHVLRNGFRLEEWVPRGPRAAGSPVRVGVVAELSHRKGIDRIEMILRILGDFPVEIDVVGEGLSEPGYAKAVRSKLESPQVRFLGRRNDIKNFYPQLDFLLVPSRQDPLPTVIVEAGLCGVPVIGSRVGGIPEMIVEGENGFLFSQESEAAAAIRNIHRWDYLARGARLFAEEHYDIEKLTHSLREHYAQLLARQKTSIGTRANP